MTTRADAALAACGSYDREVVLEAVRTVLEPFGGMGAFVSPGETIGIKPNLLLATHPDRGITTHPAVVAAVMRLVLDEGARPVLIESTGAGLPQKRSVMERTLRKTGMRAVLDEFGLPAEISGRSLEVSFPGAHLTPRLDVLRAALEVDGLINLPKLKTHTFMTFTGAVKNLFGFVPGLQKAGYHAKLADTNHFADMLLDLALYLEPRLNIMDAVVGLEGDGPGTGGVPVGLGFLAAAPDATVLDAVACRSVGLSVDAVPTLRRAVERGLWHGDVEGLAVHLHGLPGLPARHIEAPKRALDPTGFNSTGRIQRFLRHVANDALNPRPRPRAIRCTGCGACAGACPVQAIDVAGRLARVDDERCIRCYCCHELCPDAAIELETGRLAQAAQRLGLM